MAPKSFGNWIFEKKLGSGGFGQVELWKEKNTNKRIAIKICILPSDSITQKQMERWKEEVKHLKILNHVNIVKSAPLPREMHFDGPILCMEFCNGGDLRKVLRKPENSCGLIQSEVLSVMKDISSAICFLHSLEITHRDIKPENIVLHKQTNEMVIYKLIDLGYAKKLGNETATASLVGTFSYVAPELFWTNRYTSSVDYWSLGILFFEVLTGYKPFMPYTENIAKWVKSIQNKQYEEICAKEIDERITFFNYIIHPTDLSEITLSDLVEWFQIALQSNPKKRGKCQASDEVVIFTLLKKIFPWRVIKIFSVSSYRFDHCIINSNTTLFNVQTWIETKFSICMNEQEIVNSSGTVLNEIGNNEKHLMKDIPDSLLYVYKKNCLKIPQVDNGRLPEMLDTLLVRPTAIKEHSQLRQCFTAIIYVMRQEVVLFKEYIYALGVKLDIIKKRIYILGVNVHENLPKIELLFKKVKEISMTNESSGSQTHQKEDIDYLCNKIKIIHSIATNTKTEQAYLQHEISNIFDSDKLIQSLQIIEKPYKNFLEMFESFENEKPYCSENIIEKVNELSLIFGEFYDQKVEQFESHAMNSLVKQLMNCEVKLNYFEKGIKSSIELILFYEAKLSELDNLKKQNSIYNENQTMAPDLSISNMNQSLVINDDAEIRDNIVLRAILDQRLQELQTSLNQFQMFQDY